MNNTLLNIITFGLFSKKQPLKVTSASEDQKVFQGLKTPEGTVMHRFVGSFAINSDRNRGRVSIQLSADMGASPLIFREIQNFLQIGGRRQKQGHPISWDFSADLICNPTSKDFNKSGQFRELGFKDGILTVIRGSGGTRWWQEMTDGVAEVMKAGMWSTAPDTLVIDMRPLEDTLEYRG